MRSSEQDILTQRQQQKSSVTAKTLETAHAQADIATAMVQAGRDYLNEKHAGEQFPLMLDMYWKLQAGMEVLPEREAYLWYTWANRALGGFGSHIPQPLRKRIARELCEATLEDLKKPEHQEEIEAVIAAIKDEEKESPAPWSYEKADIIMSLVGNEEFSPEMLSDINHVEMKVKNKETEESAPVRAKVQSYQISGPLSEQQQDLGLKREVILVVRVAKDSKDKFFTAIKAKCKGFKVEELEAFRSPSTQGKILLGAAASEMLATYEAPQEMIDAYIECALWSSTDMSGEEDGNHDKNLDENYSIEDIAPDSIQKIEHDCSVFLTKAKAQGILPERADMAQVGHDFWLTRNGHGTGFWDDHNGEHYDTKENAEALTKLSKEFGGIDPVVGDDGKVHFEGGNTVTAGEESPTGDASLLNQIIQPGEKKSEAGPEDYTMPGESEPQAAPGLEEGDIEESLMKALKVNEEEPEEVEEFKTSFKHEGNHGTFEHDGIEYRYYASDDDARQAALDQVKQDLEQEPELFSQEWLQHYLTVDDANIIADEDARSYWDDQDGDDVMKKAEEEGYEMPEKPKDEDGNEEDWTDAQVDAAREYVIEQVAADKEKRMTDNPVQYFVEDEGIYTIEDLLKASFISIDVDAAAEAAVQEDGWAHFLNHYDGNYAETPEGVVYFRET